MGGIAIHGRLKTNGREGFDIYVARNVSSTDRSAAVLVVTVVTALGATIAAAGRSLGSEHVALTYVCLCGYVTFFATGP